MPTIEIENENIKIEVPEDTELQKAVEEAGSMLPFACRSGTCGTCMIKVKEGLENLSEKTPIEEETLEAFGASEDERLACQCRIKKGKVKFSY